MKRILAWIVLLCCCAGPASAQIGVVRIGVNGLTCSQCTRSVEKKLRQLPFVADVSMNLANTSGEIRLQPGAAFRPAALPTAVRDAGFSVRFVHLLLRDPAAFPRSGNCLSVDGLNIRLTGALPSAEAKLWVLQLLGAAFGGKQLPKGEAGCGGSGLQATVSAE